MRVLITGITGFVGSHLAEYGLGQGAEVYGSIRWRSKTDNILHLTHRVQLLECDLRDPFSTNHLVATVRPDFIFHLAGQSFVPTSWHAPSETLSTNVLCQVNLLEAIRTTGIDPRIQVAGSSEEYGLVEEHEIPISEINPLRPLSPYAVSKVTQDLLGYQYYKSYDLKIIRTRAFNHTGPRRGEVFASSNFARQIAGIEAGLQEPVILVGNLKAKRDLSDVRDIARGYWLALERGRPGEVYNLCSETMWSMEEVLDILLSKSQARPRVVVDPRRLRPSDVPVLCGDSTKVRRETGWHPEISLDRTLEDLLNYWREKLTTDITGGSRLLASDGGRARGRGYAAIPVTGG